MTKQEKREDLKRMIIEEDIKKAEDDSDDDRIGFDDARDEEIHN